MGVKPPKRCTLLTIMEMQIKTTMTNHHAPIRMATINNFGSIKYCGGNRETGTLVVECKIVRALVVFFLFNSLVNYII